MDNNQFLNDLQDYLNWEEAKDLQVRNEDLEAGTFKIESLDQANFFLKLYNQAQSEIDSINNMCDSQIEQYIERVNRFRESNVNGLLSQMTYYQLLLKTFTEDYVADKKKKSIKLPEGTLSVKKQQPKYIYDDEKLLAWLKENKPEFIKTKVTESIDKSAIKKEGEVDSERLILDGMLIDGVNVIRQEDGFTVKPAL